MGIISGGKVIEGATLPDGGDLLYEYDFAVDGGAVGTINLRGLNGTGQVPNGFVVLDSVVEVLTIPTSGGAATIAVQANAANDVVNAAAISGAPWSTTGRKAGIPVAAASSIKMTADRNVAIVVAVAALTAGKFLVRLSGYDATRS